MDTVMNLISQFKDERTDRLENIDKSKKPRILTDLEEFADDPRVADFLLAIASDETEYDLARIEAFKIFEVKDFADRGVHNRVGRVIRNVLSASNDNDVRNYAAIAASNYMDIEGVAEEIDRLLHDDHEDS